MVSMREVPAKIINLSFGPPTSEELCCCKAPLPTSTTFRESHPTGGVPHDKPADSIRRCGTNWSPPIDGGNSWDTRVAVVTGGVSRRSLITARRRHLFGFHRGSTESKQSAIASSS